MRSDAAKWRWWSLGTQGRQEAAEQGVDVIPRPYPFHIHDECQLAWSTAEVG